MNYFFVQLLLRLYTVQISLEFCYECIISLFNYCLDLQNFIGILLGMYYFFVGLLLRL